MNNNQPKPDPATSPEAIAVYNLWGIFIPEGCPQYLIQIGFEEEVAGDVWKAISDFRQLTEEGMGKQTAHRTVFDDMNAETRQAILEWYQSRRRG